MPGRGIGGKSYPFLVDIFEGNVIHDTSSGINLSVQPRQKGFQIPTYALALKA